jgi:hypothetical protein
MEASMDGSTLFDGSSRTGCCGCRAGGNVAASGSGSLWDQLQHSDQLVEARAGDGKRGAWSDGRAQAEEAVGRTSRVAPATLDADFTLRGLVDELAERGLNVDYRSVWNFVHEEKLSFKKRH